MADGSKPGRPAKAAEAPKRTTKSKAARHAEATGTVAATLPSTGGRPSVMTPETCDEILRRISLGETLMQICDDDPAMPDRATVQRHVERDASFASGYSRARVLWAIAQGDVILDIADDAENDWVEKRGFGGQVELRPNKEVVDRSKLRIETRKWLMERYGKMLFSIDATKLTGDHSNAADDIKKDATVIAPDEPGPDKPVL